MNVISSINDFNRKPGKEAVINWSSPYSRNLIGAFLMNERSDLAVKNYVSKATAALNNMTGGTGWAQTPFGYGLNYDGADDFVSTSEAALVLNSNFTWLTWVYFTSLNAIGSTPITWDSTGYFFYCGNAYTSLGRQGIAHDVQTSSALTTKVWHQLAVTITTGLAVKIYIDGIVAASGTTPGSSPAAPLHFSDDTYLINGIQDHVMIWSRVLDDGEILSLYNRPFVFFNNVGRPSPTHFKRFFTSSRRAGRRLLLGVGS